MICFKRAFRLSFPRLVGGDVPSSSGDLLPEKPHDAVSVGSSAIAFGRRKPTGRMDPAQFPTVPHPCRAGQRTTDRTGQVPHLELLRIVPVGGSSWSASITITASPDPSSPCQSW